MSSLVLVAALVLQQQAQPAQPAARVLTGPQPTAEAVAADTGALRHANGRVPPVGSAVRADHAPRIDGRMDDPVWALARPLGPFTQRFPNDGDSATQRTEVRLAYDDDAVYVFARMFDTDPGGIAAQLGRRDDISQSDMLEVDLDSYHDHRTSFQFYVNPLGVKADVLASDDNGYGDDGWDPVWDVATQRDSLGWTAEFRIPLSQIRFPNAPTQVWGANFFRQIHRNAELSLWGYSAQTDNGYASNFGHVFGFAALPQPRRLEVLPYATGAEERLATGSAGDPFNDGSRETGRVGLDLKYGLTSNLTLNATVNPDFGQVEQDPAVVNLSAYETYLSERRPFFVEGAGIFSGGGQEYFYSRRIGRQPQLYASAPDGGYADQPTSSTILAAAKLTGRTAGGWSLGLLEAATAREYATLADSTGLRSREVVEPFTNYAVLRAKRDLRGGASTVGFIATAVNRRIDDDRLDFLRSSAYTGGVDVTHRFSRSRFSVTGSFGVSSIGGDTAAIRRAQTSSARYFQRPDAGHVAFDPLRTSLTGWTGSFGFNRLQGAYTYSVSANATSPGFEINDLGYQTRADRITTTASVRRRWTRPGRVFRSSWLYGYGSSVWNFGGRRLNTMGEIFGYGELLNYWSINAIVVGSVRSLSDGLTRGGPLGVSPAVWTTDVAVSSDYRKKVRAYLDASGSRDELGGWSLSTYAGLTVNPTASIRLSFGPSYYVSLNAEQFVVAEPDPTATAMYDRRYLFAEVLQRTLDLTTRVDVTLTPTLSIQVYAQPFVGTGHYRRFKELVEPRTTHFIVYGETPGSTLRDLRATDGTYELDPDGAGLRPASVVYDPDFSMRSLRGNAVLRWEYRPGSTLFLVWTTSCSAYGSDPAFDAGRDLRHLCQGRSDNVFAVKLNYWMSL